MARCITCNESTNGTSFCSETCFLIRKKQFDEDLED